MIIDAVVDPQGMVVATLRIPPGGAPHGCTTAGQAVTVLLRPAEKGHRLVRLEVEDEVAGIRDVGELHRRLAPYVPHALQLVDERNRQFAPDPALAAALRSLAPDRPAVAALAGEYGVQPAEIEAQVAELTGDPLGWSDKLTVVFLTELSRLPRPAEAADQAGAQGERRADY